MRDAKLMPKFVDHDFDASVEQLFFCIFIRKIIKGVGVSGKRKNSHGFWEIRQSKHKIPGIFGVNICRKTSLETKCIIWFFFFQKTYYIRSFVLFRHIRSCSWTNLLRILWNIDRRKTFHLYPIEETRTNFNQFFHKLWFYWWLDTY